MAWQTVNLDGEKNGSNARFTVPFKFMTNTEKLIHNGRVLYEVAASPAAGQYILEGSEVTVGLAPQAADEFKVRAFET